MKRIGRVVEPEVIAEFLRNEYFRPEYDCDRERFAAVVHTPDLNDEHENHTRKALFYRRRSTLWRELPRDTEWWEVALEPEDVPKLMIFPRAHWCRIAAEDYNLLRTVERIRQDRVDPRCAAKIADIKALSENIENAAAAKTVLLIGVNDRQPFRILEGNHRIAAAFLHDPQTLLENFRVVAGFSPRMRQCCWYDTNLYTLARYLRSRIQYLPNQDARMPAAHKHTGTRSPAAPACEGLGNRVVS
jgi:hypothetical protein